MIAKAFPLIFILSCTPKKKDIHEVKINVEEVLIDLDDLELEDLPEAGEDTGQ